MTDPALHRCAACGDIRVLCESYRDMERRACCEHCTH